MIKYNLQFFGGRGSSSGGELGSDSGENLKILKRTDIWSLRHNKNNEEYVDSINESVRLIQEEYNDIMNNVQTVESAKFAKASVLGAYGDNTLLMSDKYTNISDANAAYDKSSKTGYHPSRGDKNGIEAVALHELGHALTDTLAAKGGFKDLSACSKDIVKKAYKQSRGIGGTKRWAGKISRYAQHSYSECVAEAVSDYYCNGAKASKQSKAIVSEIRKRMK